MNRPFPRALPWACIARPFRAEQSGPFAPSNANRSPREKVRPGSPFVGPHFRRSSRTAPGSRCVRGYAPLLADSFLVFLLGQPRPMSGERFLLEIGPELG